MTNEHNPDGKEIRFIDSHYKDLFRIPDGGWSVDNMLKITSDGRKLGLDQRLMNPLLPDDPDSKLNACVGNILRIWQDGQADKLTQLVFCDLSTPKNDGTFNVYDDVKTKLIANGVPAEEVAFIHDADTEAKKKDLFAKVRTGQV